MAVNPGFVVVSGLPGAGKSSLAEPLAAALGMPLISKDAIKEALFDAVATTGDWQWSKTLSRAADAAMVEIAARLPSAVLDNYWYEATVRELLAPLPGPVVEVYCRVDPELARERWQARQRHPGHADALNPTSTRSTRQFPLGMMGPVVEVDTSRPVDVTTVAAQVSSAMSAAILPIPSD